MAETFFMSVPLILFENSPASLAASSFGWENEKQGSARSDMPYFGFSSSFALSPASFLQSLTNFS